MIRLLLAIGLIAVILYIESPRECRRLAGRVEAQARSVTATIIHVARDLVPPGHRSGPGARAARAPAR
jgi:hypothetical protein